MLFTPRLLLLNEEKTTTIRNSALLGQTIYLVPRRDCSFRRMRLAGTGRQAKAAAHLKSRSESLADENGSCIIMDKSVGDAEDVSEQNAPTASIWNFPISSKYSGRYLPETLAQVALDNGARIVHGTSGYEGQIWKNNNLVASRWWGRQPTDFDWDRFLRASQATSVLHDMSRPATTDAVWREDLPIFDIDAERAAKIASPFNVATLITVALFSAMFYISGQYLRESLALNKVKEQAMLIREDTEQIQTDRRRALANMNYVRKYRRLGDNGLLIRSLGAVAGVIGTTDLGIAQMNLRDDRLELRLRGRDEVSVPDVVTALERAPILSGVSISIEGTGAIVIKADVSIQKVADQSSTASSNSVEEQGVQ